MIRMRPITDAQQRFVTAYLANGGNGTRAAFHGRILAAVGRIHRECTLLKRPKVEQDRQGSPAEELGASPL